MRYLVPALLLVVAGGLLLLRGFAAEKPPADRPIGALIVVQDERGIIVGTYPLTDAKQIEALEGFFPDYRDRPSSRTAGAWRPGYTVYFDTGDGRSLRVTVSPPSIEANVWTMNHGDLPIKGDFHKFVADLVPPAKSQPATPMPAAWGESMNGLSGRLTVVPEGLKLGRRHVVSVELKNDSNTPFAVIDQPRLEAELSAGRKSIPDDSLSLPQSGPIPNPQWGVIPPSASLNIRVDLTTAGVSTDGPALLIVGGKMWKLALGTYELRTVVVAEKSKDGPDNQWVGRLTLPPVEIVIPKPSSK